MKMPRIVGFFSYLLAKKFLCSAMFSKKVFASVSYLIFMSMKNFMSAVEHKKSFITSGPGLTGLGLWKMCIP